ncbi:MAG: MFS transporter [Acidimicrobiales bacterium]|nr:MFS transporter [Acidimicrobiales bacterium]
MTRIRAFGSDTFRSLQIRNFRLFFTGQLISQIGNWLTLVAQTLLVLELTDSGVALGLLAAAQFGPVLVLGAFAGLMADRSDKRRLLVVVQTFAMFQSFVLAALAFMDEPPVAAIYAVATLGGIATAFDNPVRRSFVVELVPEDQINNAVGLNSALMTGSRVIGPALGGFLIVTVGFGWAFLLDGLSYVAVIVGLRRIDPTALRRAPVTPRGKGQVRAGVRYARSIPELWVPLLMMAVIGTLAFNFQTVLPLFATRDLDGSDLTFALLMSVVSMGSLVGALASARRRDIGLRMVTATALAFGGAMALLAIAPNQPTAFAAGVLLGVTSISFMTSSTAIVQIRSDPSMRGRVLALQAIVFLGSTPIGGPIVGAVSESFGARYGIAIGAAATLGAGLYGLVVLRRQGRLALTEGVAVRAVADASTDLGGGPVPSFDRVANAGG